MRDYAKISPMFWIGPTGKQIKRFGPETQVTALYLLTSPHANMIGLYYCPLTFISHETGLTFEGASKGLRSLIEVGFCAYDGASEYVWVPEMARFQIGGSLKPNDNRVEGIKKEYNSLPDNPYLADFFDKYHDKFHLSEKRTGKTKQSPFEAPSEPLRSQEQEQEQEQEKNTAPKPQNSEESLEDDLPADAGDYFDEVEFIRHNGADLLKQLGANEKQAYSVMGKALNDYWPEQVETAIGKLSTFASETKVINPVGCLTDILKRNNQAKRGQVVL